MRAAVRISVWSVLWAWLYFLVPAALAGEPVAEWLALREQAFQQPRQALTRIDALQTQAGPDSERALLELVRANAHAMLLQVSDSTAAINRGLALAGKDSTTHFRLRLQQAANAESMGRSEDALQQLDQLLLEIDARPDSERQLRMEMLMQRGTTRANNGLFGDAIKDLRQAEALIGSATPHWLVLLIRQTLADALSWSGNWQDAMAINRQLLDDYPADSPGLLKGYLLNQRAWLITYESGVDAALGLQAEYRQLMQQYGSPLNRLHTLLASAYMLADARRPVEARALLQQAEPLARQATTPYPLINWHEVAARVALSERQEKAALDAIDQAITLNDKLQSRYYGINLRGSRAQILASFGRHEEAMTEQGRAMEARLQALRDQSAGHERRVSELSARLAEREAEILRRDNALQSAQIAEQERRARVLVIGASLLSVFVLALMALLWRNRQISRRLRELANTDVLTGLPNRRAVMARAEQEFERIRRYPAPFSVAVLDLDHFKLINDRFGHEVGDDVLRRFAVICRGAVRSTDIIGRTGGEEFVLLMPQTDAEAALQMLERLREQVARIADALPQAGLRTRVSIGVASCHEADDSFNRLLLRADQALYAAKAGGRDRVQLADAPGSLQG